MLEKNDSIPTQTPHCGNFLFDYIPNTFIKNSTAEYILARTILIVLYSVRDK